MEEDGEIAEDNVLHLSSGEGNRSKIGQDQIQNLLFGEKLSWQAIIYDLINSEQLNPWDIDISLLSNKYLDKVRDLETHNFFVSSKVLLAAALLLRIKSEILLEYDLRSLDDILFGKKEEKKYVQERIELDDEIPDLIPRTPLPRFRKVSLQELIAALGKAITTETRRIKRVVVARQQEIETAMSLPKKKINILDQVRKVYDRLKNLFSNREEKLAFSELSGQDVEERIAHFIPLLYLDTQHKVWLEQEGHLEEIWILLKEIYEKKNSALLEKMKNEVDEEMDKIAKEEEVEEIEEDLEAAEYDEESKKSEY